MRTRHIKRISRYQEQRLAKMRGGKTRWGSGSGPMKEDVGDPVGLAQCKFTEKDSISLHHMDLRKVLQHAAAENRLPYMELLFVRRNPLDSLRVYVVFETEFKKFFPGGKGHATDGFVLG